MDQIITWIKENSEVISAIFNVATLAVWLFYAQLFYHNYARQRRPRLSLNQAQGYHLDGLCLLVNMSKENMYVECVVAVVYTSEGSFSQGITAFRPRTEQKSPQNLGSVTRQGPLSSGAYQSLGTFGELLQSAAESVKNSHKQSSPLKGKMKHELTKHIDALELRVAAIYGPEDSPVGARRRFFVAANEYSTDIMPEKLTTTQMTGPGQRREVKKWLHQWWMRQ
jgi:hypothetical protein